MANEGEGGGSAGPGDRDGARTGPVLAGRYRLGRVLGQGGMAVVHEGFDGRLDRRVAVKVLRGELAADPSLRIRFEAEARSAARLVHPNVVSVFDTGESLGRPWIVMEQLSGETLADRIQAGPLDEASVTRMAGELLAALGTAHSAGIVHRDVKPGNILVAGDGSFKVADFGIAKGLEPRPGQAADLTATAMLIGTPAYLAPERLAGQPATERSDLWSVGVVLYEALAGVKPFVGATPLAVAGAIQHTDPVPLAERCPDVSPAMAATVARALARAPEDRFESAAQMVAAVAGTGPAGAGPRIDPTALLPDPANEATSVLPGGAPGPAGAGLAGAGAAARISGRGQPERRPGGRPDRPSRRARTLAIAILALVVVGVLVAILLPSSGPVKAPSRPSTTPASSATVPSPSTPTTTGRTAPSASTSTTPAPRATTTTPGSTTTTGATSTTTTTPGPRSTAAPGHGGPSPGRKGPPGTGG